MFRRSRYMNYYVFKKIINALMFSNKCKFMLIYDSKKLLNC